MKLTVGSLTAALALAAAASLAAPAHAGAPLTQEDYSGTETFSDCGLDGVSRYSGHTTILDTNPSLGGQFFRFTNRYSFDDTLTDPATGDFVTVTASGVFKEVQPRLLEGDVYEYTTHDTGLFTIRDSSGAVLVREAGLIGFRYTFDTLGDGQPGGTGLTETLTRLSGPHATWDEDFDFCAVVTASLD